MFRWLKNTFDNIVTEKTPAYGVWCGPGRTANDGPNATEKDLPKDVVDCLGWLHDKETKLANTYFGWKRLVAWNTANLNWVSRNKKLDNVLKFANAWWGKRLGKKVEIPFAWDKDYLKVYKPGSRRLFRLLSIKVIPFMRNQKLLNNAIDESFFGKPPR